MGVRVRQRSGRRAGDRQERSRRGDRGEKRAPAARRDPQQGAGVARHRGRREPEEGVGTGVRADRRRTLPQPDQLQGRVPLPKRQHQAGAPRDGVEPLPVAEVRAHVGRRTAARRRRRRPGRAHVGRVPPPRRRQRALDRGHPGRVRLRRDREAPPAGGRISETGRRATLPSGAGNPGTRCVREDRMFSRRRAAVPGRDRR